MGYPRFFVTTALIGIPVALLCLLVRKDTLALEAQREAAEAEPDAVPART